MQGVGTTTAGAFNVTNSTEVSRLFVRDDGNVGIGTTWPTFQLQLSTDSAAKPGSNTWTVFSDERVKRNIRDFSDGLSVIRGIRPVWYQYNGKSGLTEDNKDHIGVVAQEIKKVAPYTISTHKTKLNPGDTTYTEFYTFNSHALAFASINAIKELDQKIALLSPATLIANITQYVKDALAQLGFSIENGVARLKGIITATLEVGSPEAPTGITLYDEDTREPYCLKIKSGEIVKMRGKCG